MTQSAAAVRSLDAFRERLGLRTGESLRARQAPWGLEALAGRLVELSGRGASAALTMAVDLVWRAQHAGEPVAWVLAHPAVFFAPDLRCAGVDLEALLVVRVPPGVGGAREQIEQAALAAERLLRSGAFGLVVLDLGSGLGGEVQRGGARAANAEGPRVPTALQARLTRLAQKHDAAVVCLTEKSPDAPSLSSMVSLRLDARRHKGTQGWVCSVAARKDKRRGPGWRHELRCAPPDGLEPERRASLVEPASGAGA